MISPLTLTTSAVAASLVSAKQAIICDKCGTPIAELAGGFLIIRSKHHGESHLTVLNLVALASGLRLL